MATYYVDPTRSTDGTGTISNPFNSFDSPNASGFMTNNKLLIKRGTRIRDELRITNGETNWTVGAYGTGARPIIDGSDIVTQAWKQDATGWYIDNDGGGWEYCHAIIYNGVSIPAYATAALMDANAPALFINDRTTSNAAIYINLGGVNPNTVDLYITGGEYELLSTTRREACLRAANNTDIIISDLHFMYGDGVNCWVSAATTTGNNRVISGCRSDYSGGWSTAANSGGNTHFSMLGRDNLNICTGIVFVGNESYYGQNNLIETSYCDGAIIHSNNSYYDSMGVELWEYVTNASVKYNKFIGMSTGYDADAITVGHGNGLWVTGDDVTNGNSTDIVFAYNLVVGNTKACVDVGSTSDNVTIRNNTLWPDSSAANSTVLCKSGSLTVNLQNNIIGAPDGQDLISSLAGTTLNCATNFYHQYSGNTRFKYSGTTYSSATPATAFTNFSAVSGDAGGVGDPLFTDTSTSDYTIGATSPAYQTGVDYTEPRDFAGNTLYTPINCGCYDNELVAAQESSLSIGVKQ